MKMWQITQMGRLLEEFDDDLDSPGMGDEGADGLDSSDELEDDLEGGGGEPEEGGTRVQPPVPAVDPAMIARAVTEGIRPMFQQQQQAPQMTEEEFRKATDYFAVNNDMAKQLASVLGVEVDDDRASKLAQFFQQIVDGSTRHALKTAGLMQGALKEELSSRVVGIETAYQRKQTEEFLGSVQTKYPALKQYRQILPDILNQLKASGVSPKTHDEAVKLVAKAARDHVRKYVPNFMSAESPGRRTMASSLTSGGASTGGFGAGGNKKSKAASLPW